MINAEGEQTIIIPPRFLPELRKLPDSVLSLPKAVDEVAWSPPTTLIFLLTIIDT